jgi:hypothetical protein
VVADEPEKRGAAGGVIGCNERKRLICRICGAFGTDFRGGAQAVGAKRVKAAMPMGARLAVHDGAGGLGLPDLRRTGVFRRREAADGVQEGVAGGVLRRGVG